MAKPLGCWELQQGVGQRFRMEATRQGIECGATSIQEMYDT